MPRTQDLHGFISAKSDKSWTAGNQDSAVRQKGCGLQLLCTH
jgi:hypothetical protein